MKPKQYEQNERAGGTEPDVVKEHHEEEFAYLTPGNYDASGSRIVLVECLGVGTGVTGYSAPIQGVLLFDKASRYYWRSQWDALNWTWLPGGRIFATKRLVSAIAEFNEAYRPGGYPPF